MLNVQIKTKIKNILHFYSEYYLNYSNPIKAILIVNRYFKSIYVSITLIAITITISITIITIITTTIRTTTIITLKH